ncbi:MAG: PHB depolymerase family esterase [Crocinitomicaceae bacterium]|nr:PHB depolymerase family esterase [Crocinitomicaceae bacterium]
MLKKTTLSLFLFLLISLNISISQTYQRQMDYDGINRSFVLHIPANYNGTTSVPLLFVFHGGGGVANQFMAQTTDMRPIADTAGFILVYPQAAVDPADGSNSWLHKSPTTHNDIFFIETLIDSLSNEYLIDNNRVYACGYSEGGIFSYELGCRINNRIAAFASVSGSMLTDSFRSSYYNLPVCSPSHPTAVLLIPGTADSSPHSSYSGFDPYYMSVDEITTYWSSYNNTNPNPSVFQVSNTNTNDGSTVERRIWENGTNCVTTQELKVIGGGHDWPGSFGNMDIDASSEIWNFVSQYNMNGLISCSTNSISEIQESIQIKAYPNPVINNELKIELNNYNLLEIRFLDGRLVWSNSSLTASDSYAINTSNWNAGMYLIYQNKQQVKKLLVVNN